MMADPNAASAMLNDVGEEDFVDGLLVDLYRDDIGSIIGDPPAPNNHNNENTDAMMGGDNSNDVFVGVDAHIHFHNPTNVRWRSLLEYNYESWQVAGNKRKKEIVCETVIQWQNQTPRGRFLKVADCSEWTDKEVRDMVVSAFTTLRTQREQEIKGAANPKDVLIGRGRGFYNWPGTKSLRQRVEETFFGYEVAGDHGQKTIATKLVDEVLLGGGKFLRVCDGRDLTKAEAIDKVRKDMNQQRKLKKKKQGKQDENVSPPSPPLSNYAAVAGSPHQETGPQMLPVLPNTKNDEVMGDKARLLQKLSDVVDLNSEGTVLGDWGEELAGNILNILELAASDGTVDALLYSDQMRAAFKTIVSTYKSTTPKRAKRGGDNQANHHHQHPAGVKAGTKSVVSGGKKSTNAESSVEESLLSYFASAMRIKKDTLIDKVIIVSGRVFSKGEEGEKKYYGTTLDGLPEGIGVMIYTKKDKWVIGHWRKGKLHGLGCAIDEDDHRYFGLFAKERLHGKALYRTDESTYLGEYRKHQRHGRGKLVHKTIGTFDGHFRENRFEGNGAYTAPNGDRMVGDFVDWNMVSGIEYKKDSF